MRKRRCNWAPEQKIKITFFEKLDTKKKKKMEESTPNDYFQELSYVQI